MSTHPWKLQEYPWKIAFDCEQAPRVPYPAFPGRGSQAAKKMYFLKIVRLSYIKAVAFSSYFVTSDNIFHNTFVRGPRLSWLMRRLLQNYNNFPAENNILHGAENIGKFRPFSIKMFSKCHKWEKIFLQRKEGVL